jgi:hypothetical protein
MHVKTFQVGAIFHFAAIYRKSKMVVAPSFRLQETSCVAREYKKYILDAFPQELLKLQSVSDRRCGHWVDARCLNTQGDTKGWWPHKHSLAEWCWQLSAKLAVKVPRLPVLVRLSLSFPNSINIELLIVPYEVKIRFPLTSAIFFLANTLSWVAHLFCGYGSNAAGTWSLVQKSRMSGVLPPRRMVLGHRNILTNLSKENYCILFSEVSFNHFTDPPPPNIIFVPGFSLFPSVLI